MPKPLQLLLSKELCYIFHICHFMNCFITDVISYPETCPSRSYSCSDSFLHFSFRAKDNFPNRGLRHFFSLSPFKCHISIILSITRTQSTALLKHFRILQHVFIYRTITFDKIFSLLQTEYDKWEVYIATVFFHHLFHFQTFLYHCFFQSSITHFYFHLVIY